MTTIDPLETTSSRAGQARAAAAEPATLPPMQPSMRPSAPPSLRPSMPPSTLPHPVAAGAGGSLARAAQRGQDEITGLVGALTAAVARADARAAAARVVALRVAEPAASADALAERIIRARWRQAATIGAVTSSAALVPGVGTLASLTIGVAADVTATLKLQAEMVLELAAAYGVALDDLDRKRVLLLVAGVSTGTATVVGKAGRSLARAATERVAQRWLAHAVPVVGIAASAGVNGLSTYMIGRSASAYFRRAGAAA